MLYCDYSWDLHDHGIILDKELDASTLSINHKWAEGDYFKLIKHGDRMMLVRVNPPVKFLDDGAKK